MLQWISVPLCAFKNLYSKEALMRLARLTLILFLSLVVASMSGCCKIKKRLVPELVGGGIYKNEKLIAEAMTGDKDILVDRIGTIRHEADQYIMAFTDDVFIAVKPINSIRSGPSNWMLRRRGNSRSNRDFIRSAEYKVYNQEEEIIDRGSLNIKIYSGASPNSITAGIGNSLSLLELPDADHVEFIISLSAGEGLLEARLAFRTPEARYVDCHDWHAPGMP